MYWYLDTPSVETGTQRHILRKLDNDAIMSFPATEDNPHMVEYLAWLAEGNSPELWNSEVEN